MQTTRKLTGTVMPRVFHSRRLPTTGLILKASIFAALATFALPRLSYADVLGGYNFGASVASPTLNPTTVGSNVSATPVSADSGLALDLSSPATQPPSAPYLRTTFITASTTPAAAVTNNADFKFTLTADAGFLLNLSSFTFDVMRGGAGTPRGYVVRSSVDNFASTLGQADVGTVRPTFTNVTIDLTGAAYQSLGSITFKVYGYSPATGSSVDYDNLLVNGTVSEPVFSGYLWKGTADGNWNTTSPNWTGAGSVYVDGAAASNVLFDDSAARTAVSVTPSAVNPRSVSFTNATASYSFSGSAINVATNISKSGAGSLTFNNAVSATNVSISGGNVTIGTTGTLSSANLNVSAAGALTVATGASLGAATALTASGPVTFNNSTQTLAGLSGVNTGIVTLNDTVLTVTGTSTYEGQITGTGSLVKDGTGTLNLTGFSDFSGGTTVKGGALQVGSNAAGSGAIIVQSGGALALAGFTSNLVTLTGGTIGSAGAQTLGATLTVAGPSTVDVFNPATGATPADLIITGALEGSGNLRVISQNGNTPDGAAFRLRGPTSSGASAYSGTITVGPSAKFELQTSEAMGSQMGTGTLVVTGGNTSATNAGTYSLINLRNNSGANVEFGNNVQVSGVGTSFFNLLGNSPAGSIVAFSDLLIGDGQGIGAVATASAAFTLAFNTLHLTGGNATFTPQPVANTSFISVENISLGAITETVAGSGITMNGAATLSLTGANSYTGPTVVSSGTLLLEGSITGSATSVNGGTLRGTGTAGAVALNGGTLAPGIAGAGILKTGNLALAAGSLAIEIAGTAPGNTVEDYDQIQVAGSVAFSAPVNLTLDFSTYDPVDGRDQFVLISNDLADPVNASAADARLLFEGMQLDEGTLFTANSGSFTQEFRITYAGGSNSNDVLLFAVPEPSVGAVLLLGAAGLLGKRRRLSAARCS